MRLNLGCGDDIRPGYINVDFRNLPGVAIVTDLSVFPWPFDDGSAEEILMLDFLEHFPYHKTRIILMECYRVLNDKGRLVIQVPDGDHLAKALSQRGKYLCNRCGNEVIGADDRECEQEHACTNCSQTADEISEAAMRRLYGGQNHIGNFHQTCFTKRSLALKAADCGFSLVDYQENKHQYENWNFKALFMKGDVW